MGIIKFITRSRILHIQKRFSLIFSVKCFRDFPPSYEREKKNCTCLSRRISYGFIKASRLWVVVMCFCLSCSVFLSFSFPCPGWSDYTSKKCLKWSLFLLLKSKYRKLVQTPIAARGGFLLLFFFFFFDESEVLLEIYCKHKCLCYLLWMFAFMDQIIITTIYTPIILSRLLYSRSFMRCSRVVKKNHSKSWLLTVQDISLRILLKISRIYKLFDFKCKLLHWKFCKYSGCTFLLFQLKLFLNNKIVVLLLVSW